MNVNELIIGNRIKNGLVSQIGYNKGMIGVWVVKNSFDSSGGKFVYELDIMPLSLQKYHFDTEDWIKLGSYMVESTTGGNFKIIVDDYRVYVSNEKDIVYLRHVNYVHELQNIYFYLLKKELTIKLTT